VLEIPREDAFTQEVGKKKEIGGFG